MPRKMGSFFWLRSCLKIADCVKNRPGRYIFSDPKRKHEFETNCPGTSFIVHECLQLLIYCSTYCETFFSSNKRTPKQCLRRKVLTSARAVAVAPGGSYFDFLRSSALGIEKVLCSALNMFWDSCHKLQWRWMQVSCLAFCEKFMLCMLKPSSAVVE